MPDDIREAIERAGGPAAVAKLCRVSVQAVCFWRDGRRRLPVEHVTTLAKASGVPRWALRPVDWALIWPELIGADGAPPPPADVEVRDAA